MDSDQIIERGRAVQEMQRSQGWLVVKEQLEREIQDEEAMRSRIDTADRDPSSIGSEYVARSEKIAGLKRVLEIAEGLIEDMQREQGREA